jgi:hypothetical protein
MNARCRCCLAAASLFLVGGMHVLAADPPAAADQPGDLWEVTSKMSMEGMPMAMPAQKVKVCAPKVWTEPPGGADERRKCTNSDFKMEGEKATWKVTCEGPPPMTGEGEIIRQGADAWTGAVKFASEKGTMTINLSGNRLEGCDNPVQ